jgi:hypothetical protein
MADANGISKDVVDVITQTLTRYEAKGGVYFADTVFEKIANNDDGSVLFQTDVNAYGQTIFRVNTSVVSGRTLEELNEWIKNTKTIVSQSVEEAVIHECGHGKAYYRKTPEEIKRMNDILANKGKAGISQIALDDGAETIAEVEVLLSRGQSVPKDAIDLYNRYTRGGK